MLDHHTECCITNHAHLVKVSASWKNKKFPPSGIQPSIRFLLLLMLHAGLWALGECCA